MGGGFRGGLGVERRVERRMWGRMRGVKMVREAGRGVGALV